MLSGFENGSTILKQAKAMITTRAKQPPNLTRSMIVIHMKNFISTIWRTVTDSTNAILFSGHSVEVASCDSVLTAKDHTSTGTLALFGAIVSLRPLFAFFFMVISCATCSRLLPAAWVTFSGKAVTLRSVLAKLPNVSSLFTSIAIFDFHPLILPSASIPQVGWSH